MARIHANTIIEGTSGVIGRTLVVKRIKGGRLILAAKPTFAEDRVFSPGQIASQMRFRAGIAYAKKAAQEEPIYAEKAIGTPRTAFNVALADFLRPPEILHVDLAAYTGKVGESIRAQVRDDVCVKHVKVSIVTADDRLIEQGEATQGAGLWWNYTTTANGLEEAVQVIVQAWDLPGNEVVSKVKWETAPQPGN